MAKRRRVGTMAALSLDLEREKKTMTTKRELIEPHPGDKRYVKR